MPSVSLSIPRGLLALMAWLLLSGLAAARPAYKKALADFLGLPTASKLNDCRSCHLPTKPGQDEADRPHNPFGVRLKALKAEWKKTNRGTDILDRIRAIAEEDSDGDGIPNLLEMLAGSNAGESADRPGPEAIAAARQKLAGILRQGVGYRWAPFEKVQQPAPPKVKNNAWVKNPIDAFIAASHEEQGLTPRPEAPREVWLRRVYLDLIGLPPTPKELHVFLQDAGRNPQAAVEHVVEDLLGRPQYGERWGRHWMDVWRYSDWAGWGAQVRDSQPHIWHWRDWIVESINGDKPYDRMVVEMLAGDEIAPDDPDTLRATGYLVRNYKLLSREKWLQDTVEHTFLAFQGVTINCARCHDHMYDPILQKDYYQARAFFEPHNVRLDRLPGEGDLKKNGLPRVYDADLQAPTFLFIRGDDRTPDKASLKPGVPEALGGRFATIQPVALTKNATAPDGRRFVREENLLASQQMVGKAREEKATALVELARHMIGLPQSGAGKALMAKYLADIEVSLAEAHQLAQAALLSVETIEEKDGPKSQASKEAAKLTTRAQRQVALAEARKAVFVAQKAEREAKAPAKPDAAKKVMAATMALTSAEAAAKLPDSTEYTRRAVTTYPPTSTGRRLALARWIADRDNPLTARVAMNHIWMRHFGQAIVPSVFEFGRNGRPPSHPALLDYLAVEFMNRGWSMKQMHRLIVTSAAYRLASTPDDANLMRDRDNKYLWRMAPRRLEAEVVRDCMFHVAGRLDLTRGGPDLDHGLGMAVARRSLYFRHAAEKQMAFLKIFDCASVTECYQRKDSILPQQALALANSEVSIRNSRLLARDLAARFTEPASFTSAAFEHVLSRGPTSAELGECLAFLKEQALRHTTLPSGTQELTGATPGGDPALHARENLVHVLMNHHDFVTLR